MIKMKNAPFAMIQNFIQRWSCNRFAPLLTAYVEGGLPEKQKAKVAEHIKSCAACRQEAEELTALGQMLRAHPPAVPQLKPDLWSRIQAEITAESAAEPERPLARPLPRRQPAPNFQWSSFGLSFATTGTLVAAAVVGVVVLTKPLVRQPVDVELPVKASGMSIAAAPTKREPVVLEFRLSPKPGPEPKAKTSLAATALASTARVRPAQPVRAPQVALVRRRERHSNRTVTVPVARTPRPISAAKRTYFAVAVTDNQESGKTLLAEPTGITAQETAPAVTEVKTGDEPRTVAMAVPEPLTTETPDEVVAPRDVPAAGSVNDSVKFRARQILFVYSGR